MIEISHGWTPTTPAIQPAEACSVPTWITQSKNSLGCSSKPPRSLAWSSRMPAGLAEDPATARRVSRASVVARDDLAAQRRGVRGDVGRGSRAWVQALLGAVAHDLGEGDGDDQAGAVEGVLDPALVAEELQAEDAGREEVDRHHRPDRVERARLHDGGAEEDRGQGRQQVAGGGRGVEAADGGDQEEPGETGEQPAGDVGAEADPLDPDAGQPGDLAVGADEDHAAADRRPREQVGQEQGQRDPVVEGDRHAEHVLGREARRGRGC